jgi:hypothetical protein
MVHPTTAIMLKNKAAKMKMKKTTLIIFLQRVLYLLEEALRIAFLLKGRILKILQYLKRRHMPAMAQKMGYKKRLEDR